MLSGWNSLLGLSLGYLVALPIRFQLAMHELMLCHHLLINAFSYLHLRGPTSAMCLQSRSAVTLLVGWQEGHLPVKTEWWGVGVVICLERGADLHTAQLMPLPLTVSCFSKIQIGFTFLVPAHPGSPGQRAVKRACVCVYVSDDVT